MADKILRIVFAGMAMLCACTVAAQKGKADKALLKELKQAYKYRTDLPKEALEMTKKWPDKVGVLHNDWIENLHGRSYDLKHNEEIMSWQEYEQLQLCCDSFFVSTGSDGKKGCCVRGSEHIIAPQMYDEIDFDYASKAGVIIAREKVTDDMSNYTFFTITGKRLCMVFWAKFAAAFYYPASNIIVLARKTDDDRYIFNLYWPDGTPAFDGDQEDGKRLLGDTYFYFTPNGDTTKVRIDYINADKPHPRLSVMKTDQIINQDYYDIERNKWKELADKFEDEKKWKDAAFCYDFLLHHELSALRNKESRPNYENFVSSLMCHTLADNYQLVINRAAGNDAQTPMPKVMGMANGQFYAKKTYDLNDAEKKNLGEWLALGNETYGYAVKWQAEKEANDAQTAAAIAGAVSGALNTISQGIGGGTATTSARTPAKASGKKAQTGTTSSSSSESSSGSGKEVQEVHEKCPGKHCDNGTCSSCGGSGKGTRLGNDARCSYCNGSGKCTLCEGKGYRVRYKYQ